MDGTNGRLTISGYAVDTLAPRATFEETIHLLWHDRLPNARELAGFKKDLAAAREAPPEVIALLQAAANNEVEPIEAARMGLASIPSTGEHLPDAKRAVAVLPTIVAAYHRLRTGLSVVPPAPELGHAACYLYMLTGRKPSARQERALDTYLNTVVDHGLNASTFTARVIISTRSDMISALTGALGALKGPLHGGAPGPALETVHEVGDPARAEEVLRAKLVRGERLMGFGHRVYRVRDPRADVLAAAAQSLYEQDADAQLYALAREVERVALRLLAERKPERSLKTNVEFYTALVLHGVGMPVDLFTPTFAIARAGGWTAHCFEQAKDARIIRPTSEYVGARERTWVPLEERSSDV